MSSHAPIGPGLVAALMLAALAGCGGNQGTGGSTGAIAEVAGCYQGTGLRLGMTAASAGTARADSAAASSAHAVTLVLDSVVEPGGERAHARLAVGHSARAGSWSRGPDNAVGVIVTGEFPPVLYMLRLKGQHLVGSARPASGIPGFEIDTTSWKVDVARTTCAPVLSQLASVGGHQPPVPAALRTELVAMGAADQAPRRTMTQASVRDTAFMLRLIRGDSARTQRLAAIVAKWGWPTPSRAGQRAADGAFLVLQHSPSKTFQRRMLPLLDSLARVGEMNGQNAALLTDRVLEGEGLPQRYGSQFNMKDGHLVLYPIADSAGVAERRAALGLIPLAEYEKLLAAMYHTSVKH